MECSSIDCSSMASIAAFVPGGLGSKPGLFAVSNSSQNLSVMHNTSMWYSSKCCYPERGDTLVGGDE